MCISISISVAGQVRKWVSGDAADAPAWIQRHFVGSLQTDTDLE